MLEKNSKKKVEEKNSKNFLKFSIEKNFRAKKSQVSSKKTRIFPEIFDRKKYSSKSKKMIGKCVKKIEIF